MIEVDKSMGGTMSDRYPKVTVNEKTNAEGVFYAEAEARWDDLGTSPLPGPYLLVPDDGQHLILRRDEIEERKDGAVGGEAPVWMSQDAAYGWDCGYNAALDALLAAQEADDD